MTASKSSALLIDDNKDNLENLAARLRELLPTVEIREWRPSESDGPPEEAFNERVDSDTVLVVTDYDLTTSVPGLFGLSIVGWCQTRSIPVGDFSRGNVTALLREPNLFELRVPTDNEHGAAFIANVFKGFDAIRRQIEGENPRRPTKYSRSTKQQRIMSSNSTLARWSFTYQNVQTDVAPTSISW